MIRKGSVISEGVISEWREKCFTIDAVGSPCNIAKRKVKIPTGTGVDFVGRPVFIEEETRAVGVGIDSEFAQ